MFPAASPEDACGCLDGVRDVAERRRATPPLLPVKGDVHMGAGSEDLQRSGPEVLADFLAYTSQEENSNRVGEFAIGTNIAVKGVIGNILQDEKLPGLHLAFGHPYTEHTGAHWSCRTHLDIVGRHFDVWFDAEQVMEDGKFLI